jgi:hypothetical protein
MEAGGEVTDWLVADEGEDDEGLGGVLMFVDDEGGVGRSGECKELRAGVVVKISVGRTAPRSDCGGGAGCGAVRVV